MKLKKYLLKKRRFLKTFIFLIFCFIIVWISCLSHEFVHQVAFRGDDINSKINFYYGFPLEVQPQQNCESRECVLINGINEIVEYNLTGFLFLFIIAFAMIIYILDNKK